MPSYFPLIVSSVPALALVLFCEATDRTLPNVPGYTQYPGYCACDASGAHPVPPKCGPATEIHVNSSMNGTSKTIFAASYCDERASCHGFAIDVGFDVLLFFNDTNFTRANQPNPSWNLFWQGPPQPVPPPPSPPRPTPPFPSPDTCATDEECSLNGICDNGGRCICNAGWHGHHCQWLNLQPVSRVGGYGYSPNITSWGGSIFDELNINATGKMTGGNTMENTSRYHLFVTEEINGKGLSGWAANSQIIHATAESPLGPFVKQDVVTRPSTSNPQILYDRTFDTFLLFHIAGGGSFRLSTAPRVTGPWASASLPISCNNPTAAFAPNGTLFYVCHEGGFTMYWSDPNGTTPAWKSKINGPIELFGSDGHPDVPGNCEDPFLFFDRHGFFHVIAHCYTCYWYPSERALPWRSESCLPGSAWCSGHGFSRTGASGSWTWVGGDDAPYNFTVPVEGGGTRAFSTRERPWGLMGGDHGDQVLALINGVSPQFPQLKFVDGIDWCYTNIQAVAP
eukprot:m.288571 g.288571  ORF g.288571 m.288571 type:complete len:510 (-) comp19963_c0_seq4:906-2435(-)